MTMTPPSHFESKMTMMPDVIEKKWRRNDDLAISVNDAAPCKIALKFPESNFSQNSGSIWFMPRANSNREPGSSSDGLLEFDLTL